MKPYAKRDDIKMANLQDTIMKGLSGMSNCINELLQCRETKTIPNYRNIIPQLLKTTALLGHVCRELSFKRKEAIRPILHPDFKPLCSKNHKVGPLLFGEDLAKTAQDIRSSAKTVLSLTHQTGQNNFNKRYHAQGPSQPSKPFLSQRERPQFPPRKPQHYLQRKASTKK
jgi:hypothetical protein